MFETIFRSFSSRSPFQNTEASIRILLDLKSTFTVLFQFIHYEVSPGYMIFFLLTEGILLHSDVQIGMLNFF